MSLHGFGQIGFAEAEFGDGLGSPRYTRGASISVSYSILPPGIAPILVTYDVQVHASRGIVVVYYVAPAIADFSINGILCPRPHHQDFTLPAQVGLDQLGVPILQGRTQMVWTYDNITDEQMRVFMSLYDPANPNVILTYPNELGQWVAKEAMWQPPNWGTRSTIEHKGVTLTFTHISSD